MRCVAGRIEFLRLLERVVDGPTDTAFSGYARVAFREMASWLVGWCDVRGRRARNEIFWRSSRGGNCRSVIVADS